MRDPSKLREPSSNERFMIYEPYGHGNVFTTEIYSRKEEWSAGEL